MDADACEAEGSDLCRARMAVKDLSFSGTLRNSLILSSLSGRVDTRSSSFLTRQTETDVFIKAFGKGIFKFQKITFAFLDPFDRQTLS